MRRSTFYINTSRLTWNEEQINTVTINYFPNSYTVNNKRMNARKSIHCDWSCVQTVDKKPITVPTLNEQETSSNAALFNVITYIKRKLNYIYIYIHIHTHVRTYTRTYIHTYRHTYIYTYIPYVRTYVRTRTHAHILYSKHASKSCFVFSK